MENIKQTIANINEGFNVTSETDILPVYYGNELVNGAAYRACRFKHFMQHTGQAAIQAYDVFKQAGTGIDPSVKWTFGMTLGCTALALADKFFG